MAISSTSSIEDIRIRTGHLIGFVLDRLVKIHTSDSVDDRAEQELNHELQAWTDAARQAAACRLTDSDCAAAFDQLEVIVQRLRERPAGDATANWLRTTAREIDTLVGDDLRRLSNELCPPSVWDDPDEYALDDSVVVEIRDFIEQNPPPTEAETPTVGYLDLTVDEKRGEVRRASKNGGRPVYFQIGSAMWHWFIVAYRAGSRGATKEQVQNGYPRSNTPEAMRQARANAQKNLRVLGIGFEDGFPLQLVAIE